MPIAHLTPEQERALAQWREDWFRIGAGIGPVDRERVEAAITGMYSAVGLRAPRFEWTRSPAALLQTALQHSVEVEPFARDATQNKVWTIDQSEKALRDSVGGVIGATLWDALQKSMGASLHATLDDAVGERVYAELWSPLDEWVERAIWQRVREWLSARKSAILAQALRDTRNDPVHGPALMERAGFLLAASGRFSTTFMSDPSRPFQLRWSFSGQHNVGWVCFFSFCEQVLGVRYEPGCGSRLKLWAELCHTGWWAPYEGYCICAERPSAVHIAREADGTGVRLHNAQGPALEFPDGTQVNAVEGIVR